MVFLAYILFAACAGSTIGSSIVTAFLDDYASAASRIWSVLMLIIGIAALILGPMFLGPAIGL